jgi:hypothetical protein
VEDRFCGYCGQELRPGVSFCPNRVLFLVIVAPVLLAIAWFVFQFAVGFLNGFLNGLLGG